jgi:uncharacterized protein
MAVELRRREREEGFPLLMSLTTNAKCLDEAKLRFMAAHRIAAYISLDGPHHVHSRLRPTSHRAFQQITDNIEQASGILHYLGINTVYGPETISDLPESVDFLSGFGLPVHLNWDIVSKWEDAAIADAPRVFDDIAQWLLAQFSAGRHVELHPFEDKILQIVFNELATSQTCTMGVGELSIDINGDIYPCERLVGHSECIIGDLSSGIDVERRSRVVEDHKIQDPACETCSLETLCRHDCGCTNWHMTGTFGQSHHVVCSLEKALIGAVYRIWESLSQLSSFREYLFKASRRRCISCHKEVS